MLFSKNYLKRLILFALVSICSSLSGYEYNLVVCAIFKDNAPFLKEWIEFHQLLGVEHFYLFDNSSTDHPKKVLNTYIKNGVVTLTQWPNRNEDEWGKKLFAWVYSTQLPAYKEGLKLARKKAKWVAFIDTDEFIVPMQKDSILKVLQSHKDSPGISIKWQCFGTSNVLDIPKGKLMVELLKLKCRPDHPVNGTKLIIKTSVPFQFVEGPHRCVYLGGAQNYVAPIEEIRIHHYINRTVNFFYKQKIKNKETMDNNKWDEEGIRWWSQLGNDIEDHSMDRFIPKLRERMGFK